jgi:hypothetical protein
MYDIALQRYKCTCMYIEIRFQTTKNCHLHTIYESRTEGKTLLTSLSDYRNERILSPSLWIYGFACHVIMIIIMWEMFFRGSLYTKKSCFQILFIMCQCTCMYIEIRFQTTKNCHLHTIYESRTEGKTLLTSLSDYRIQLQDNGN